MDKPCPQCGVPRYRNPRGEWACKPCKAAQSRAWRQRMQGAVRVVPATKTCGRCKVEHPSSNFHRDESTATGLNNYCKPCRIRLSTESHKRNPERRTRSARAWSLRTKYGLTEADVDLMVAAQGGCCAICHKPFESCPRAPHATVSHCVDHDHVTGEVRGLLCVSCNHGLGHFFDSPEWLRNAAVYLEFYSDPDTTAVKSVDLAEPRCSGHP